MREAGWYVMAAVIEEGGGGRVGAGGREARALLRVPRGAMGGMILNVERAVESRASQTPLFIDRAALTLDAGHCQVPHGMGTVMFRQQTRCPRQRRRPSSLPTRRRATDTAPWRLCGRPVPGLEGLVAADIAPYALYGTLVYGCCAALYCTYTCTLP